MSLSFIRLRMSEIWPITKTFNTLAAMSATLLALSDSVDLRSDCTGCAV